MFDYLTARLSHIIEINITTYFMNSINCLFQIDFLLVEKYCLLFHFCQDLCSYFFGIYFGINNLLKAFRFQSGFKCGETIVITSFL